MQTAFFQDKSLEWDEWKGSDAVRGNCVSSLPLCTKKQNLIHSCKQVFCTRVLIQTSGSDTDRKIRIFEFEDIGITTVHKMDF